MESVTCSSKVCNVTGVSFLTLIIWPVEYQRSILRLTLLKYLLNLS